MCRHVLVHCCRQPLERQLCPTGLVDGQAPAPRPLIHGSGLRRPRHGALCRSVGLARRLLGLPPVPQEQLRTRSFTIERHAGLRRLASCQLGGCSSGPGVKQQNAARIGLPGCRQFPDSKLCLLWGVMRNTTQVVMRRLCPSMRRAHRRLTKGPMALPTSGPLRCTWTWLHTEVSSGQPCSQLFGICRAHCGSRWLWL